MKFLRDFWKCCAYWRVKNRAYSGAASQPVGVYKVRKYNGYTRKGVRLRDEHGRLLSDKTAWYAPEGRPSLSDFKSHWIRVLTDCDIPEPYWSVKWITEHVQKTVQSNSSDGWLSREQLDKANEIMTHRLYRLPVQYIIGEWDFRTVTLSMRPPVFIPEPETEELVGLALENCNEEIDQSNERFSFLDLCCGSGAISVSLLAECPEIRGYAVDISDEAVLLTKQNAARNHVEDRLTVLHCSVADSLQMLKGHDLTFNLIISNPPYIASDRVPQVQPEVYRCTDHRALDGGGCGLEVVAEILSITKHLLTPNGQLWLETDVGQTNDIHSLVTANQIDWELMYHSSYHDYADRFRFHKLVRKPVSSGVT